jgi:pilus assembly protein CpaE
MDQVLQLAIITNDHFRAETLGRVTQELKWQLTPCVGQADPREWLRRRRVDVALVDLDVPQAIALMGDLSKAAPHIPLLALVTPQHLVDLQDALVNGATGFVAFPVESNQFMPAVLRAVQSAGGAGRGRRGRIVTVAGLKGGVGRTTLAANLAVALRQSVDEDVILVEAHNGLSDLSLMINLLPHHTVSSLADEETIDHDLVQGLLYEHSSRIKVLAAPAEAADLVELPLETWRQTLEILSELAPYVVIDTAAVADGLLAEVLSLSDDVLIITGPDLASLRSAVVLLNSLDDEQNVHARSHVVLNRAGVRGGVTERASREQVGQPLAAILPDDPALATFALNRGVPYVLSHQRSILTRETLRLMQHVFAVSAVRQSKNGGGGRRIPLLHRGEARPAAA